MKNKTLSKTFVVLLSLLMILSISSAGANVVEQGIAVENPSGPVMNSVMSVASTSLAPVVTETGKISLSIDGYGDHLTPVGSIDVEKPAGATVRSAYLLTASLWSGNEIPDGGVTLAGFPVNWDDVVIGTYSGAPHNHRADVTNIVKPIVDAAPAGRISIPIEESDVRNVEGNILAVIFDDPNQVEDNTVVLLFGAQSITGDMFNITLAEPVDKTDPNFALDMSLGISFGFQPSNQYSIVNVNGLRLTSSAGGYDDGTDYDGGLITVGGLDDSNANPADPNAPPGNSRSDDELYDLIPFVNDGDTGINVFTQNPSNDDNIYFAAFFMGSTNAIVGEGILLSPDSAINNLGESHEVTATVQDDNGAAVTGTMVHFEIASGPNAGTTADVLTDTNGEASFSFTSQSVGTDVIVASFFNSQQELVLSNEVTKKWIVSEEIPEFPTIALPVMAVLGLMFLTMRRREE
ncbi:Ig-like domain-containing protein [Methanococcoides burtonii]|uniref:Bacterial Ig-like domain (Group 1) containing protein n=1 Tax=Methanococcoides burtonii (strain DSM 6242 / NBRC 107633 / OCM 468 / ACE-M) TaxID=259564 RepID=Q12UJ4_METBU|nr:Ig-like domain-containing protein [Methanococcoides burtonii]ABE52882.1 bacterial Ig-like domain (group 1) containing protein [Methanococcoides burtonii DSM 6242]